jgi:hypothetical protein
MYNTIITITRNINKISVLYYIYKINITIKNINEISIRKFSVQTQIVSGLTGSNHYQDTKSGLTFAKEFSIRFLNRVKTGLTVTLTRVDNG